MEKDLHFGHRERVYEKFLAYPDSFLEHEILETLLFPLLPRIDTNAVAHNLLLRFGSLYNIFNADINSLMTVKGIGKKTATEILVIGKASAISFSQKEGKLKQKRLDNFSASRNFVVKDFASTQNETFAVYILDKGYKLLHTLKFTNNSVTFAEANITDIVKGFSVFNPSYILLAHNHPSGSIVPSLNDDTATKKLNLVCELHGVKLCDHLIVGDGGVYSYFQSGALAKIQSSATLNNMSLLMK